MRRTDGLRVLLVGAALAALLVLATAGPAAAAPGCEGPPGSSAIDQYCETVPGAGGDGAGGGQGTGQGRGGRGDSRVGSSLAPGTSNALRRSGRDGDVLRGLPGAGGQKAGRGDRSADGSGGASPSDPSGNPISALGSAVDGGSSVIGPWLVWILVAVALVLGGFGWMRYRRNTASGSG